MCENFEGILTGPFNLILTQKYFQVHSETVRFVMDFQLSPYCESKEENADFQGVQKFFVGTDLMIRENSTL